MSEDAYAVKRSGPRVAFVAAAELTERAGGSRMKVRVSELSARGCYVDTLNPFGIGTKVDLLVSHEGRSCALSGKVIYSHAGYGMGVVFEDLPNEQRSTLDSWIAGGNPLQ